MLTAHPAKQAKNAICFRFLLMRSLCQKFIFEGLVALQKNGRARGSNPNAA
jgi:hypothetical protein